MDFTIPEEIGMLRQLMRRFIDDELIPLEMEYADTHYLPDDVYEGLRNKARAVGLWNLAVPEEFGGAGLGVLETAFITEISSRGTVPAISLAGSIWRSGFAVPLSGNRRAEETLALSSPRR